MRVRIDVTGNIVVDDCLDRRNIQTTSYNTKRSVYPSVTFIVSEIIEKTHPPHP